jgi:acyl-coenzyme A thioesterase PaaI-like protein
MDEIIKNIPKLKDHHCFACGTANPIGLKLTFYRRGEYVCSDIKLGKNYEGWENMAHGGIISTLLDEVMGWTVIYFKKVFFVTKGMNVKYISPVPLHRLLTIKGRIIEEENSYSCKTLGIVQDEGENILARGEATFAILSEADLYMVSDRLKKEMKDLFGKF